MRNLRTLIRLVMISLRRLGDYLRRFPLVSFLYIVSGLLSVLCILFVYPTVMPHMRRESNKNQPYRFYRFMLSNTSHDYNKLFKLLEPYELQTVTVSLEVPLAESDEIREIKSIIYISENSPSLEEATMLSQLKHNEIIAPEEFHSKKLKLWDEDPYEYKVRYTWQDPSFGLNPEIYQERYSFDYVSFYTTEILSSDLMDTLIKSFQEDFPISGVRSPQQYFAADEETQKLSYVMLTFIFVLGVLTYVFLLIYLVNTQRRNNRIYRVLGLSFRQGILVQVLDVFFSSLVHALLASLIHKIAWTPFFRSLSKIQPEKLYFSDYAFVLIFSLCLSLFVLLPYAISQYRVTLASSSGDDL